MLTHGSHVCAFIVARVWLQNYFLLAVNVIFVGHLPTCSVYRLYSVGWQDARWSRKDMEESGSGLMEVLSQHFPGRTKETRDKPQPEYPVSGLSFEPSTFRKQDQNITSTPVCSAYFIFKTIKNRTLLLKLEGLLMVNVVYVNIFQGLIQQPTETRCKIYIVTQTAMFRVQRFLIMGIMQFVIL